MKADVVAAQKAAFVAGQDQVLEAVIGAAYDGGIADAPKGGGFSQEQMDAAVASAVAPLNDQIAKDAADLKAAHDQAVADLAAVQAALVDMTAKEQLEEQAVAGVKEKADQLQAALDVIKGLLA